MSPYFDAGVIVKLYVAEPNSGSAVALVALCSDSIILTVLQRAEVRNAINLKVFRKEISTIQADAALAAFENDIARGIFRNTPCAMEECYRRTEELSFRYSRQFGTRAFDALNVAMAESLGVKQFASFDLRQRSLASALGMEVLP